MEQQNNKIIAKPFVKWAGGKGSLIKQLVNYLPNDIEEQQNVTYIEPFVGWWCYALLYVDSLH